MKIHVTGLGWVGAAGAGVGRGPVAFALPPGALPRIASRELLRTPDARFGRMDAFSQLALAGVVLALRDAGIEEWKEPRAVGIAASTRYGCLQTDIDYLATLRPDPALASPQLFAFTLPNIFLGEAAIRFGLTGPSVIVSDEEGSGAAALDTASDYVASGGPAALAGICDLERPAPLPSLPAGTPGALFVVLERRPSSEPLGTLDTRRRRPTGLIALAERLCGQGRPAAGLRRRKPLA